MNGDPQDTTSGRKRLGRYELVQRIGQGGMGEVYLARLTGAAGFEKPCIVKTILPSLLANPQFVERFHHEAKVLVHLVHSNIAQVYDMGEADQTLFMALEYVPGVDLAHVIERARAKGTPLPVPFAVYVAQKMAEGLGYAHRKTGPDGAPLGIAHRDVSPHNVMVSYDGEVKLIDFGLAKSAALVRQTLPSTVMGKLGYMSPEQARGEPVDRATDIYSLGVVVWELLAGRPLIPPGTMGEMMAAMMHPRIPSLREIRPELDEALDAVVRKALAPDPKDRYARAEDFGRALHEQLVRIGRPMEPEEAGALVRALCPEAPEALAATLVRPPAQLGQTLEQSLGRLHSVLAKAPGEAAAPLVPAPRAPRRRWLSGLGVGAAVGSAAMTGMALTSGDPTMFVPAGVLGTFAAFALVRRLTELVAANLPSGMAPRDPTRPHIGLGATVADDAVVEPGAAVEMGATIRSGAVIKRGAVVRMGATVGKNATVESEAQVGWGATVHDDAVVGERARVGAGSDVKKGAHVPPGTSMMPGSTWSAGIGRRAGVPFPASAAKTTVVDPRRERLDAACDKLEAELAKAPGSVRDFLGASANVGQTLRRACHELLQREQALRAEASAEALGALDREQAALEKRIAETADPVIQRSLRSAVAAIAEQKRQRESLVQSANRIDADLTRLIWTIDGVGMQLVRVRSTPAGGAAPGTGLVSTVQQLHEEITALADALEEVRGVAPVAPVAEGAPESASGPARERV